MTELRHTFSAIVDRHLTAIIGIASKPRTLGSLLANPQPSPLLSAGWSIVQTEVTEYEMPPQRTRRDSGLRPPERRSRVPLPTRNDDEVARALLDRARSGDADAFADLFALHRTKIRRLCTRMLDDVSSAEDATSEIYVRAGRALSSYDADKPFHPWLRTLASNYCIDQLRRRKTERSLFSSADLSADEFADDTPGALTRITRRQEQHDVIEALDRLPDKYRLPLVLRFYRDLGYDAIAEILGVTRAQVGSLLFRAKQHLREELIAEQERAESSARGRDARNESPPSRRRRRSSGKARS